MKYRHSLFLLLFCANYALADFTNSSTSSHPALPHVSPFVIDISGVWPSDCHPGEQQPVIREYDGDSVLIEFETIVEHVTCNEVPTPYRVLVDMSDVVGSVDPQGNGTTLDITVRFDGAELETGLLLSCASVTPCPKSQGPDIKPEPGLYGSEGLEKQGILLARQNDRMGVYPLIYDETGNSQWLFGGGGIVEDIYFVKLKELYGGQCLGCPPPENPPQMDVVGKLTMLMDSEGVIQVKVNNGLFEEYRQTVYGYGELKIGGSPRVTVADLSGRWAFSESDTESNPNGSVPPTDVLPLVFDIVLESVFYMMPPIVLEPPTPPGNATYSIWGIDGAEVARMKCTNFFWGQEGDYNEGLDWACIIPELESEDEIGLDDQLFRVNLLSPERIRITYSGIALGVGCRSQGIAVRID